MTGLVLGLAVLVAVAAVGWRRLARARLRQAAAHQPGASLELAIPIRAFGEIEDHLAHRWCHCGGYLERRGEGPRETGGRRYRIVRLVCQECESPSEVYFDTTEILH